LCLIRCKHVTQVLEASLRPLLARWLRLQVFRAFSAWCDHVTIPLRTAKVLEQDLTRRRTERALMTWQQNAQTAVGLRTTVLKIMMSSTRVCAYAWRTYVAAMKLRKARDATTLCLVIRQWQDHITDAHHRRLQARALARHCLCSLAIKAWARVCMWNAHIDANRDRHTTHLARAMMRNWRINIRVQSKRFSCLLHFVTGTHRCIRTPQSVYIPTSLCILVCD
jgi:hypothetical protein